MSKIVVPNPVHEDELQLFPSEDHYDERYVNHGVDGEGTEDLNYLALNTSYTPTGTEPTGTTYWDSDNHCATTVLEWGAKLQNGFELYKIGTDEGNNWKEGAAVSVMGATGNRVAFALTDTSPNSTNYYDYVGLITTAVDSGNRIATREGAVNGVDTTGAAYNATTNPTGMTFSGETWTEGDTIFVDPDHPGFLTNVRPDAPNITIRVGTMTIKHANQGQIELLRRVCAKIEELCNVNGSDPDTTGDLLTWNQTNKVWDRDTYNINDYLPISDFNDTPRFGFVVGYDGTQQTTISFDGTNTFTLAPTGTTWEYWRNGVKYTITGSKTCVLPGTPVTKGLYYINIDSTDGTLSCTTTGWTLEDTKVPVATINWDNSLTPKYWMSDERHSVLVDRRYHWEHHFSDGTEMITTPTLSGYTVAPASPANTDNTFAISASIASDEDIKIVNSGIDDSGGVSASYTVFTRSAVSTWNWVNSLVPYSYTGAGYINYDNAGTLTPGQNNRYYNSWLLVTNVSGQARYSFLIGQGEYTSLSLAQSKTFSELTKTGLNINEYVAVYQLTWYANASYTTLGKVRLAAEPKPISTSASGASTPISLTHNSLSGLQGGTTGEYYHLTEEEHSEASLLEQLKDTTVTRDGDGYISEIAKTGGRTLTITRDANNYISEVTDSTYTWTFSRDSNNNLTGVTVT